MSQAFAPLAMTMGDPAGCGPQITIAAWEGRKQSGLHPFFVIADPRLFDQQVPVQTIDSPNAAHQCFANALPVLPIRIDAFDMLIAGTPSGDFAAAIIKSIEMATAFALRGEASGVVTNPISKAVLYEQGFAHAGHTEFIASLCGGSEKTIPEPVMMLVGGGLRVALATIHIPLLKVLEHLTPEKLAETARITHRALLNDFNISTPRLAFTGLNPHAGESGSIGTEELDIINPVASTLRAEGLNITDARSADTVFHDALSDQFDAVIAMTHDQGLIPVKTLDMWGGVNTTLGLPIIRTSPDHGTAYEAAAAASCRPDSLIAALKLAAELAENRAKAHA
ncbi:MAG: 4-hydroxythreonine-4-phosphate dehydrogenase PdxA [Pseudomonadota bacterium]